MLQVGFGEVDITPDAGYARAGMPFPQKGRGNGLAAHGQSDRV